MELYAFVIFQNLYIKKIHIHCITRHWESITSNKKMQRIKIVKQINKQNKKSKNTQSWKEMECVKNTVKQSEPM